MTELRSQTKHPYTHLLLHDLRPGLADNMGENSATGSEWRTAPFWSIGHTNSVSGNEGYLQDGRARNLAEQSCGTVVKLKLQKKPFARCLQLPKLTSHILAVSIAFCTTPTTARNFGKKGLSQQEKNN